MASCDSTDTVAILRNFVDVLSTLETEQEIYDFTLQWLQDYTKASLVGIAHCEREAVLGKILRVRGDKHFLAVAAQWIGRKFEGTPIIVPLQLQAKVGLNHVKWSKDIYPIREPFNIGLSFGLESVYGYPLPFADGNLIFGLVMKRGRLIAPTDQVVVELVLKQVSLALKRFTSSWSASDLHAHLDADDIALLYLDSGTIIHCSPGVENIFLRKPQDIIGRKLTSLLPSAEATDINNLLKVRHNTSLDIVQKLDIAFNERTIELKISKQRFPAGKVIVQVRANDVTEKREMERALRESESRYRELFETSTDGITVTDKNGYYIDCNPAFLGMLGYDSVEEIRGKHFLDITPEEYHELDLEKNTLLNEQPYIEFEKEYLHRNGTRVLIWIRLWKRIDTNGEVIGWWALVRDITTIRRMESDVGDIEKFKVLGELAAAISHEIRNPLTTVRGFLQLLPVKSGYSEADRESFSLMIKEIDLAATIIKDFLDLARPADPRMILFSLNDLLASLLRVLESKAIILRVDITTRLEPELSVYGDPSQLRQVFLNLIQNAFQAMPEGGTLEVKAEVQGEYVITAIRDSGMGIPEAHMARVGKPFFTTKVGGTGMGLPTCYRIVSAHSGHIDVKSQEGAGATFRVYLPTIFPLS